MTGYKIKGTEKNGPRQRFFRGMRKEYGEPKIEKSRDGDNLTFENSGIKIIIPHEDLRSKLFLAILPEDPRMREEDFKPREHRLIEQIAAIGFGLEAIR